MIPLRLLKPFAIPALLTILVVAPLAGADVAPPNDCFLGAAGSSCTTAGTNFDQDGVCTSETCFRSVAVDGGEEAGEDGGEEGGEEGGRGTVSYASVPYACVLCEPVDGGSTPGDAASEDAAGPDAGTQKTSSSQGCSTSPLGSGGNGSPFGLMVIGLVGSILVRRRRYRRG
jgi:MYXO-CTERM domain-containing protein